MPPKISSQPPNKGKLSQTKINVVKLGSSQPLGSTKRKFDPLSASALSRSVVNVAPKRPPTWKGKEKAPPDDRMWVDIYEPNTEAELAVHVRKVEDVRRWLQDAFEGGPSGKLKKYRRILALTGPAGTGKTATLKVLSKELGFEIIEWRNSIGEVTPNRSSSTPTSETYFDDDSETQFTKFETFFNRVPVVIVISDAGIRGEVRDERISGGGGWGRDKDQVMDVRTRCRRWSSKHFSTIAFDLPVPSKQVLDVIVESSNGDIRSAINTLEFACTIELPNKKRKGVTAGTTIVLEAVTRREQSLALFHLIGKVLYNKRKGDPASSSAAAKDIQKDREIDAQLKDPAKLPSHLSEHDRRASRVDVDAIYADSPIDTSLFSLYLHQNYTQFCNEVEEVDGVADWLSWVDSSGGEAWYQSNPHQFHLVTLGTMHSLPSPVQRRSQKVYKPEFFETLKKEKDARDGVRLARDWIVDEDMKQDVGGRRVGAWSPNDVTLELGAILRCKEKGGAKPPRAHKDFSSLPFVRGFNGVPGSQLAEGDDGLGDQPENSSQDRFALDDDAPQLEKVGGWLEEDDIDDDFDD
ncbi:Rad17-domain-containing protein [Coprinellus micaceus]|uniref:Rad17-domain-containing protein n=1 Tax=Coprinellus micaceus TaxID=71717 RepID=A0A4Y7T643_COPMI|nr:Rad17-domain-containing protein [Coprinellus micaceus]